MQREREKKKKDNHGQSRNQTLEGNARRRSTLLTIAIGLIQRDVKMRRPECEAELGTNGAGKIAGEFCKPRAGQRARDRSRD